MEDNSVFDQQESLTLDRLKKLSPTQKGQKFSYNIWGSNRPDSLVQLISIIKNKAETDLIFKSAKPYIHNKISIEGSFLTYCEENNVKITCLLMDSIASWKNESGHESFIVQGVFLIEFEGARFIHAALFHKGNQNEDEVSFFVIVEDDCYEKYIKFRNKYDEWLISRDRDINEIFVVGGEPVQYSKDLTWDDLYLQEDIKNEIITSVEGFFKAKHIYQKSKVPWRRGLLFFGEQGCGKTTALKVILSMYDFKPVTIQSGLPQPDEVLEAAFSYAEEHGPSLLFLEDLGDLLNSISLSHFLQLLDGVESKDGVFIIATANEINKIQSNLTDRPSRFDRRIEFTLPNEEMCFKYIEKWYANKITKELANRLAKLVVKKSFSYAYIKELYFSSVFEAIKNDREFPSEEDIISALGILTKQKVTATRGHHTKSQTSRKVDLTGYGKE